MKEWKEYKLGDLCSKIGSGATPKGGKESYLGGNIALIRSQNVLDFSFSNNGLAYINEEQADKLKNVVVEEGDVLLNITGDSVARACMAPTQVLPARVNQHVAIIRPDKSKANSYYILCYLQDKKKFLLSISNGGGTRNALTKKMLEDFEVILPSLPTQRKIASILSSLDDKIELNRRINANLEEQAQTLFKSWFIDFEPFQDGKFVDSELGMIPEAWKVDTANNIYSINIGKTPPRKDPHWFTSNAEGNNKWISISDMGSCGMFVSDSSEYLTTEAINKFNVVLVPENTILLSFKLTVGRVAIAQCELTTNEAIARFILPYDYFREYTYLYLKQYNYAQLGSTSSIATAVNSKIIKQMPILRPTNKVISQFSCLMSPLFNEINNNLQESARLSALRDTLLPKLMSGEIEI